MKGGLEFGAIVGLDQVDLERQLLEDIVEESDGGLLVQAVEDLENAEAQVSRNSVSFRRAPIANFLSSAER